MRRPKYRAARHYRGHDDVTVCIAALFNWNYAQAPAPTDFGPAALVMGDRMITAGAGDIEYEPNLQKMWFATDHVIVMIAGDYTVHSQALRSTQAQVKGNSTIKPYEMATTYGAAIQSVIRKQAEDVILAPLGLNTDTFLAQQREMSDHIAGALTTQMQEFEGPDVAALVVGIDDAGGHIYEVDRRGTVRCFDDVGFAAIGIGASHAVSVMAQARYNNALTLAPVLCIAFAAKRAAQTAPGVGVYTDIHLITKNGRFPIWPEVEKRLTDVYDEFAAKRAALALESIQKLNESLNAPKQTPDHTALPQGESGVTAGERNSPETGHSAPKSTEDPSSPPEQVQGAKS